MQTNHDLALVMTGGGARAAYQVGFLAAVARRVPAFDAPILTGVSAGAINAVYLASRGGSFLERIEGLASTWSDLTPEQVMDTDSLRLGRSAFRWFLRLASGGRYRPQTERSLVDTAPLRAFLSTVLESREGAIPGIAERLRSGDLRALAVTATSYSTGRSVTFCQGETIRDWERPGRRSQACELGIDHVMASSALPLLFPAVGIDGGWYGDGGIRLTAPLSPAIHLGARRILAISTRATRTMVDAEVPVIDSYPPPAQVAGVLLNAVFLDQLDGDALRLERVNRLLERTDDVQGERLRPIELLVFRPSMDLGRLANDYEARLPRGLRFLARGTGTRETRSNDLLSLIMFQEDYLARLLELGQADGAAQADVIAAFLAGSGS